MNTFPCIDPVATGARIKELRLKMQLSVRDISRFMGFEEPQAVYKWQRGESLPTIDNLYALSRLFNTPMDNIVRGIEEDERSSSLDIYREHINYILDYRVVPG
jgi:transcriptional regulator with XRE-family HTH domain